MSCDLPTRLGVFDVDDVAWDGDVADMAGVFTWLMWLGIFCRWQRSF